MKKNDVKSITLAFLGFLIMSFELPSNWIIAGSKPNSYSMGIDKDSSQNGKNVATIKSVKKKIKGFGTLMQICSSEKFEGKRVKMTGLMKTENVEEWAGLWFRVDGGFSSLAFDNMHDGKSDRSVKGTTDWKEYSIVLDVPENAFQLAFGALLSGKGQIWFDKIKFEIVDKSVPTTGKDAPEKTILAEPVNLDFEN